jgi:hypothetical protein
VSLLDGVRTVGSTYQTNKELLEGVAKVAERRRLTETVLGRDTLVGGTVLLQSIVLGRLVSFTGGRHCCKEVWLVWFVCVCERIVVMRREGGMKVERERSNFVQLIYVNSEHLMVRTTIR